MSFLCCATLKIVQSFNDFMMAVQFTRDSVNQPKKKKGKEEQTRN